MSVKTDAPSFDEQVAELAKLTSSEYDNTKQNRAKDLGVSITTLDTAVSKARNVSNDNKDDPESDDIIELVKKAGIKLFHDDVDVAFAEVTVKKHHEVWPVESKQFKKWLNNVYWDKHGKVLKEQPRKDTLSTLAGLAEARGKEHKVYLRSAYYNKKHYLDLCDDEWRVVEIDNSGWRILDRSPVKFRRTSTMEALPVPVPGGDYTLLWDLVNIKDEDRLFVLAWIIDSMRENTQCPVLEIVGSHGSAKSTVHKFIRRLFDPNAVDLRGAPKRDDDVWATATNNRCISYENMSTVSAKMQDTLCIIATGGGHAGRALYSNYDEVVVKALNPIIINGITPIITASDLADRAIRLHIPKLDKKLIRKESEISDAFAAAQQSILSGLLDLFVAALGKIDNIKLKEKPRMLDFSVLGEAIGMLIGSKESFNDNYLAMRRGLLIEATQGDPAITAIVEMITATGAYDGTFKGLLTKLSVYKPKPSGKDWPQSPRGLSTLVTRHEQGLSAMGIKVTRYGHTRVGNKIKIEPI